jgi:hypothetical protein
MPSPRVSQHLPNLLWIRCDLWESKSFKAEGCFPVQSGDVLKQDWKEFDFMRDI